MGLGGDSGFGGGGGGAGGDVTVSQISDASANGRSLITAANYAAMVTLLNALTSGGALGTPASGVLTNCTGTASGLTAGAVTNGVYNNVATAFSAQQNFAAASLTSSSNHIAWNLATQQSAKHVMTENTTLDNPTNMVDGGTYVLKLTQHASSAKTLAFGNAYKVPGGGGFTMSTGLGAVDILTFVSDGTSMFMVGQKAFA